MRAAGELVTSVQLETAGGCRRLGEFTGCKAKVDALALRLVLSSEGGVRRSKRYLGFVNSPSERAAVWGRQRNQPGLQVEWLLSPL